MEEEEGKGTKNFPLGVHPCIFPLAQRMHFPALCITRIEPGPLPGKCELGTPALLPRCEDTWQGSEGGLVAMLCEKGQLVSLRSLALLLESL